MRLAILILFFAACNTALISQPTSVDTMASQYLEQLDRKWVNARDYTLEVLALLPDSALNYRPTPEQMSFREQLIHNLQHMTNFSTRYLEAPTFDQRTILEEERNDGKRNKEELTRLAEAAFAFARSAMSELSTEALYETVPFFAGPLTRQQIVHLLHDHLTHHRAQMIVYLRLLGIAPPRYRGW